MMMKFRNNEIKNIELIDKLNNICISNQNKKAQKVHVKTKRCKQTKTFAMYCLKR